MSRAILLAAALIGCGSEGNSIPLPPDTPEGATIFQQVAGADAGDLWWPGCSYETRQLSVWRWSGGWTAHAYDAACDPTYGVVYMASLEPGTLLVSDTQTLQAIDAGGGATDLLPAPDERGAARVVSLAASGGSAWALVHYSTTFEMEVLTLDGGGFVATGSAFPGDLLGLYSPKLVAMGPDDVWMTTDGPPEVDWMDGYAAGQPTWRLEGGDWRPYPAPTGTKATWSRAWAPDDFWAIRDVGDDPTQVYLARFDGSAWVGDALPALQNEDGTWVSGRLGVYPGANGRVRLHTYNSAISGPSNTGRTDELVYDWDGEAWSEPVTIASHVTLSCSQPPCGVSVYGELDDGTQIRTTNSTLGPTKLVLWKP